MADRTIDTPKEISIHVETVFEQEGSTSDGNNDEGDEGFQGAVAIHTTAADYMTPRNHHPSSGSPTNSGTNSASSSCASNEDLRKQKKREQKSQRRKKWSSIKKNRHYKERTESESASASASATYPGNSPPRSGLRRTKTPTTNNLSTASAGFFSELHDSMEFEDTTASLLPPTLILEGGADGGRVTAVSNRTGKKENQHKPEQQPQPSSYRKWLAQGMLETLNVVAGITLSTTGTILSPPIAMTRNIILPSLMAILVDTLDAVTPFRVQDWLRIISSSVYHLFVVLVAGSTERGILFQKQVTLVAHSFLEAWSAPESRQVVVDGMATGVKLADALHTPEMKVLLDQFGVLGCRLVDAMASGKSKEFLQNSKDLVWTSIELACDPSTTLALAEVTAHLCHALKEVDDSFNNATPRSVRNAHNTNTYLNPSMIEPYESIEKVILSSLGMDGNHNGNESIDLLDGTDDSMNHDSVEQSIPSNVAFRVEGDAGSNTLDVQNLKLTNESKKGDNISYEYETCQKRANLDLLQKKILIEGRPQARPPAGNGNTWDTNPQSGNTNEGIRNREEGQKEVSVSRLPSANASFSSKMHKLENKEHNGGQCASGEIGEDFAKIVEDMEELPLQRESRNPPIEFDLRNPANMNEWYNKFERMETKESEKPSYVQFYDAIDNLLSERRAEKKHHIRDYIAAKELEGEEDRANPQAGGLERKAKVRILRKGIAKEEKPGSKVAREKYSNLRRLWKYPPSLLRFSAVAMIFICVFWIGFGIYGMYTLFHQVVYFDRGTAVPPIHQELLHPVQHYQQQQPPPSYEFGGTERLSSSNTNIKRDNRQYIDRTSNYHPNEIVIRIVKEVVHVREDGSRIENYKKSNEDGRVANEFSQNQKDDGKEIEKTVENPENVKEDDPLDSVFSEEIQEESSSIGSSNNNSNENDLKTGGLSKKIGDDDSHMKNTGDANLEDLFDSAFGQEEIDRVKECVVSSLAEAHDGGNLIEGYDNADGDDLFTSTLSQKEIDRVKECVASYQ